VETVEIILDNCRHLVRLLNDLLDLARSDAGRLSIRPQPTRLGPLVEDVVRTLRAQTEASHQSLTLRIDPDLPLVNVETDRIRQILVNLVTNAHEYSPERASIQVSARVADNGVEISVTDNGPGIPPAQLEHIFERFVRGDAGLTQRVGGTGLGLAISKSLVELHGGTIAADSVVGRGSSFRVTLPTAGPEALDPAPVGTPAVGEGGRR
jgi:signal transduction histidine kinase